MKMKQQKSQNENSLLYNLNIFREKKIIHAEPKDCCHVIIVVYYHFLNMFSEK